MRENNTMAKEKIDLFKEKVNEGDPVILVTYISGIKPSMQKGVLESRNGSYYYIRVSPDVLAEMYRNEFLLDTKENRKSKLFQKAQLYAKLRWFIKETLNMPHFANNHSEKVMSMFKTLQKDEEYLKNNK